MRRVHKATVFAICLCATFMMMGIEGCEVVIKTPANGSAILGPATDIQISYIDGTNPVLGVTLNDDDISDLFTHSGPDSFGYMHAVATGVPVPLGPNRLTASLTVFNGAPRSTYTAISDFDVILMPDPSGVVDEGPGTGHYSSLAFDQDQLPRVSYYDETDGSLKLARYSLSVGFDALTLDGGGGDPDVGLYSSVMVDDEGVTYISYYDATNGALKLATMADMTLDIQTVDGSGTNDVGQFTSIGMDGSNEIYISYYDVTNGDLKVARQNGASFSLFTVDGGQTDVGAWSEMVVAADGKLYIAYEDRTTFDLKYAVGYLPSLTIYTVDDSVDFVGADLGLALTSANRAVISYFDATNLDLKVARETAPGQFSLATVRSQGATGFFSSVAVNTATADTVYITFYDNSQKSLWLARSNGASYQFILLDDGGGSNVDTGRYTCLRRGPQNSMGVSYQDATNGAVYFLRISG
ncbi:hypothetical protein JW905_09060 [bacterium]|nr:hypothetical protein [candidate division CSSED10-310 bacterium]